ncbi:translocation/assembly module TamB domain-containing protein [Rhodocaloribacter litoris]|uniref:translocation/assembly module TamB domain-containing protein n=1 Tax=Rhodocaloribacter litoris TaxID=2558931 RepID=UPI0014244173|nr:translocation/assembly module TamB domain-containing protein [Rhodocaloribacter litoris]QXD14862.1 translocation/assembly module TamB domain-containing protein [Rhodocaloribacter litoris]
MPFRLLIHIPRKVLALALYAVLGLIVLFFALTRTEVGRDAVRRAIEMRFAATFEGRLYIGKLTGNLVNTLWARDVRLYDPEGRLVLAVDSVVARPRLRQLFRRAVGLGMLELFRPVARLHRAEDGTWNVAAALRPRRPDTTAAPPWDFSSADLRVVDGRVFTTRDGPPPPAVRRGDVFDYTRAVIDTLALQATIDWRPGLRQIDLLHLHARLDTPRFAIDAMDGQFVWQDSVLAIPQFELKAGGTELSLDGAVHDPAALLGGAFRQASLDLNLAPGRLDFDALRRLFPSLPLADAVRMEARLQGPVPALVVERFTLERGRTRIAGGGTLFGLPDSLDFELAFRRNVLRTRDLQAVLPGMSLWRQIRLDSLVAELYTVGVVPLRKTDHRTPVRVNATVDLQSRTGKVVGTLGLRQDPGRPPGFAANLYAEALNLGRLLRRPALRTALYGHIIAEGTGNTLDSLAGHLTMSLQQTDLAGLRVDSLYLDVTADRRHFTGRVLVEQGTADARRGRLTAGFTLDARPGLPTYRLDAVARAFDLGRLLGHDSLATRLNARLALDGTGRADPDLRGTLTLAFDTSTIRLGAVERTLPPHRNRLHLAARHEAGPRLTLSGDLATLRLEGDVPLDVTAGLGRLWGETLAGTLRHHLDKPYRSNTAPEPPAPVDETRRAQARAALTAAGLDSLAVSVTLRLHRSGILAAFLPTLPPLATDLDADLTLIADADHFRLDGTFRADSLHFGTAQEPDGTRSDPAVRLDTLRAGLHAAAVLVPDTLAAPDPRGPAPHRPVFTTRFDARADSVAFATGTGGVQGFPAPTLRLRFDRQRATLELATATRPDGSALHLAASLDLLDDRNRLTLDTLHLATSDYVFVNPEPAAVDLYADAVVVPGLLIESRTTAQQVRTETQRLRVRGTLSASPEDTVFVEAEAVALRRLTDVLAFKPRFGGRLDGRLALTGGLQRPELTGTLNVEAFALNRHILGDLTVSSRYVPGRPDVALALTLHPTRSPDTTFVHGTTLPAVVTRNRLHLDGLLRLPRRDAAGTVEDPGALDLTLDVTRADLFFFELIIGALANVEGYATGQGAIRGTFARPVFQAGLAVRDAAFDVPALNLHLRGGAEVAVDADAIRIRQATFTDKTGGSLDLTGDVHFNDYAFFSFDLTGHLDRVEVIDVAASDELPFYGHIRASGTATLTGPLYNAHLRSTNAVTTPDSELFIPVNETADASDEGFILFADSTGRLPDLRARTRRANILAGRPEGERPFLEGIDLDIDLYAPPGSTVHLVIDPLLGDVINAVGSGRIQLQRREGEFFTFGTFRVDGGDYLFTAGEVFVRRFLIENGGTLTWDGDPINALMDIPASYRTRASRAGLPVLGDASDTSLIPLIVRLQISGRVTAPQVQLSLAIDRSAQSRLGAYEGLEALLNQPERATEYATSVLLTNSFRLTTTSLDNAAGSQLAFNSVSQLVSNQLNRFLNQALPNVDFSFGLQGENAQDLDVTYGVALRLLDERLIIRGEGVYQGSGTDELRNESLQGEFVVEVRLNPNVSVEIFYRREGDVLAENAALTNTTGAGLSYQTEFSTWRSLFRKLFSWLLPEKDEAPPPGDRVATGE